MGEVTPVLLDLFGVDLSTGSPLCSWVLLGVSRVVEEIVSQAPRSIVGPLWPRIDHPIVCFAPDLWAQVGDSHFLADLEGVTQVIQVAEFCRPPGLALLAIGGEGPEGISPLLRVFLNDLDADVVAR